MKSNYTVKQLISQSKLNNLDTKVLLKHVLNWSSAQLIIEGDYLLTLDEYQKYFELYEQRLSGVPVSYILGYKEFYSRLFRVTPNTLIPRPETELLVEKLLCLTPNGSKILELGTGSGCIAISLKLENSTLEVSATDKYMDTLDIAIMNAKTLAAQVNFIQSDWFEHIDGKFDFIISNPPYIRVDDEHLRDLKFEPKHALTDFANGLTCIENIIANATRFLNLDGYLLLEHGYDQGKAVREIMQMANFKSIQTIKDYADIERITLGTIDNQ